jgi:hypothetical protein
MMMHQIAYTVHIALAKNIYQKKQNKKESTEHLEKG